MTMLVRVVSFNAVQYSTTVSACELNALLKASVWFQFQGNLLNFTLTSFGMVLSQNLCVKAANACKFLTMLVMSQSRIISCTSQSRGGHSTNCATKAAYFCGGKFTNKTLLIFFYHFILLIGLSYPDKKLKIFIFFVE